jgi:hypothetical protein
MRDKTKITASNTDWKKSCTHVCQQRRWCRLRLCFLSCEESGDRSLMEFLELSEVIVLFAIVCLLYS